MDVKVTLQNGAMWHEGRVYTDGSVIRDIPKDVALRGISNGELVEVLNVDAYTGEILSDASEVQDEEIASEMVVEAGAKIDIAAFLASTVGTKSHETIDTDADDDLEPDEDDDIEPDGEHDVEPDADNSSVDDAVNSILGHIEPKPSRVSNAKPSRGRK